MEKLLILLSLVGVFLTTITRNEGLIDLIRESLQTCLTKLLSEQNKTTTDMDNCVTAELFNNTNGIDIRL